MNKISEKALFIIKLYEEYYDLKKKYLNNFKVVEYLYNRPAKKVIITDYNNTIKKVFLDPDAMPFLEFVPGRLLDLLYDYSNQSREYIILINEYTNTTNRKPLFQKIKYLPLYNKLSNKEKEIINYLEKIKNKYNLDYLYKWDFITNGERNKIQDKIPINFSNDYVYDFFCQIILNEQLVLFVIEYCDEITEMDINKQHILYQMNVHLLRLNQRSNLSIEIDKFLKKISQTDQYQIVNRINFNIGLLTNDHWLKDFIAEYEANHIAYLKNPKQKDLEREIEIESDEEPVEITETKNDKIKKLLNKKIHFTVENFKPSDKKYLDKVWRDRKKKKDIDLVDMVVELVKK